MTSGIVWWTEKWPFGWSLWGTEMITRKKVREVVIRHMVVTILRTLAFPQMKSEAVGRFWTKVWCWVDPIWTRWCRLIALYSCPLRITTIPRNNIKGTSRELWKVLRERPTGLWHQDSRSSSGAGPLTFLPIDRERWPSSALHDPWPGDKLLPSMAQPESFQSH